MSPFRPPIATYRIQFHREFRLKDAAALLDYLHDLGVRDLYASPILKARPGSPHGYDVTDAARLNPELGTDEDWIELTGGLRDRGMGLMLDIVPNHMAAAIENPWWADTLEAGVDSPFARMFDIDWWSDRPGARGKILLPILGRPFGEALESRELRLEFGADGFKIAYYDHRLPVSPATYHMIFPDLASKVSAREPGAAELFSILNPEPDGGSDFAARKLMKVKLAEAYERDPDVKLHIDLAIGRLNGVPGEAASFDELERLALEQNYMLAFWRAASEELNYRRFFNINELVGLRVEDALVFERVHDLVLQHVRAGRITALRIDHIDGLRDPAAYLTRLREALNESTGAGERDAYPVYVEKVLGPREALPRDWAIQGTTGYDFLNALSRAFVDSEGLARINRDGAAFTGETTTFRDEVVEQKLNVMRTLFPRELHELTRMAMGVADHDRHGRDLTRGELYHAIVELSARLPVYRTYARGGQISLEDRNLILRITEESLRANPALNPRAVKLIERAICGEVGARGEPGDSAREAALEFTFRWQQFTGPAMAKGLEDTAHYTFVRLISLNEVGGEPGVESDGLKEFHAFNRERSARAPNALNASSTHDTKRSEDVRARLHVLSETPESWDEALRRWSQMNAAYRGEVDGAPVPAPAEESFLYQTMLGAWPLHQASEEGFRARLRDYMIKAACEAKKRTRWIRRNEPYEHALLDFVETITRPGPDNAFLQDFRQFAEPIMWCGALNSLSMTLLKIASPGVPDFYQGTEMWDFSLVDPDNRRPVDYAGRMRALDEIRALGERPEPGELAGLWENWRDGRLKMFTIQRALRARAAAPDLFAQGAYEPLLVEGPRADCVTAFIRALEDKSLIVVAPRFFTRLGSLGRPPVGNDAWSGTRLRLTEGLPDRWSDAFTGRGMVLNASHDLGSILDAFPLAMLISRRTAS